MCTRFPWNKSIGYTGAASQLAIYPLEVVKTRMTASPAATYTVRILYADTSDLETWFQSKLLHIYCNITDVDRSV